jgi:hypothetical protein
MRCVFFFSQASREKTLEILGKSDFDIDCFFVEMIESELFLPYSPFDVSNYHHAIIFPRTWMPTERDLVFCINLARFAEQENFDLIQFSYKSRFLKRKYERLPFYLSLRLTIMSLIRCPRRIRSLLKSQIPLSKDKEFRLSSELENLRLRVFSGYFFDDTKGYVASSQLFGGLESLKFGSLSGQRILMALARDSMFKVGSMYPQKLIRR